MFNSTAFYNISTLGYISSLAVMAIHLVNHREKILRAGLFLIALSFLLQTLGIFFRWMEAGEVEVKAAEQALGKTLSGLSWFFIYTRHPPWSNLYEIMIYMSWGLVLVTLALELRWHLSWLRQVGIILSLMVLGIASLTDASIKPLVPALKSWWIMIHVISASIAYSAGSLAAFVSLFALLKDEKKISRQSLFSFSFLAYSFLLFCLGGGFRLFYSGSYYVKLLAMAGNAASPVVDLASADKGSYLVAMPYIGSILLGLTLLNLAFSVILFLRRTISINTINRLGLISLFASFCTLAFIFILDASDKSIEVSTAHHLSLSGPYFISFKSHPWSLGLFCLLFFCQSIISFFILKPKYFMNRLPEIFKLEEITYKAISLSFFLMTIVLVTGALWAHYAWGRYWAWDPKETGALAIWLCYAIYLHTRRSKGLSGPLTSFIAVLGFFIIIVGFLGVNLGLFADGLHTYGNG